MLLAKIIEHIPIGIIVVDCDFRLQLINPFWREMAACCLPVPVEKIVPGASFFDALDIPENAAKPLILRAMNGEIVHVPSIPIVKDGVVSYWDTVIIPLEENGVLKGTIHISTDSMKQYDIHKELEEVVEERTLELERRGEVAGSLRDVLKILNSNRPLPEVLDYIVDQAARLLGTSAVAIYRLDENKEFLTIQASLGLDPDYVADTRIPYGGHIVGRVVQMRKPLALADLAATLPPVDDPPIDPQERATIERVRKLALTYRAILGVPLIVKDEPYGAIALYYPEPRKFSHEEIELSVTFADQVALAIENARLHAKLEEAAAQAERSRLARDLHDAVTQTLFSASLIAEVLPRLWEKNPDEGWRRLEELRGLTRGALAEMRTLLLELRPAALLETELGDLLRHLAEATTGRAGLPVELSIEGRRSLPSDAQITLYRIAQEALNNVVKHAQATHVTLGLGLYQDRVEMRISDDGRGFDMGQVLPKSLGLKIMSERAETIGAILGIDSQPGRGTDITIIWPDKGRKE